MIKPQKLFLDESENAKQYLELSQNAKPSPLFYSEFFIQDSVDYLNQLYVLYLQKGPAWKFIKSQIGGKFSDPKNFINNAIRSSAKALAGYELQVLGKRKRLINKDILLSMLEIVNQMQKEIIDRGLMLNEDCLLFRFKKNILKFSFWKNSLSQNQVGELIAMIREINSKLRCLSIFKMKHRKNWRITKKAFTLIASFDRVSEEKQESCQLGDHSEIDQINKQFQNSSSKQLQDNMIGFCSNLSPYYLFQGRQREMQRSLEGEANQILKFTQIQSDMLLAIF